MVTQWWMECSLFSVAFYLSLGNILFEPSPAGQQSYFNALESTKSYCKNADTKMLLILCWFRPPVALLWSHKTGECMSGRIVDFKPTLTLLRRCFSTTKDSPDGVILTVLQNRSFCFVPFCILSYLNLLW